jgi:hypothetical protein
MKNRDHINSIRGAYLRTILPLVGVILLSLWPGSPLSAQEQLEEGWLRFPLQGSSFGPLFGASSVLEAEEGIYRSRYGSDKALDGDKGSAWVEGVPGPGKGESYYLAPKHLPEALGFINGYAQNRDLFHKNHRVRQLKVQIFAGVNLSGFAGQWEDYYDARPLSLEAVIQLTDSMEPQRIPLPFNRAKLAAGMEQFQTSRAIRTLQIPQAREMGLDNGDPNGDAIPKSFRYIIRLEIESTYPGTKWEDSCIAELWPDYGSPAAARVNESGDTLTIIAPEGTAIPVYHNTDGVLTLLELSRDNQWALVIREPATPKDGRISTSYEIIHLPTGRVLTDTILGQNSEKLLPYAFGYEDAPVMGDEGGACYVEFEDPGSGETGWRECRFY